MAILIVDDSQMNMNLMKSTLRAHGFTDLLFADNGFTALDILQIETKTYNHEIELILTDVSMPKMTGIELCRILKQESVYKDVPVIMLSAFDDADYMKRSYEVGAFDYIVKPIQIPNLMAKMQIALQVSHQLADQVGILNYLQRGVLSCAIMTDDNQTLWNSTNLEWSLPRINKQTEGQQRIEIQREQKLWQVERVAWRSGQRYIISESSTA